MNWPHHISFWKFVYPCFSYISMEMCLFRFVRFQEDESCAVKICIFIINMSWHCKMLAWTILLLWLPHLLSKGGANLTFIPDPLVLNNFCWCWLISGWFWPSFFWFWPIFKGHYLWDMDICFIPHRISLWKTLEMLSLLQVFLHQRNTEIWLSRWWIKPKMWVKSNICHSN